MHRDGRVSTWGKPMPRWYWRLRNGKKRAVVVTDSFMAGSEMLPDGSTRHFEAHNGVVTAEWFTPAPAPPQIDDQVRAAYLAWVAWQTEPVSTWLAQFPTADDFPVCWNLADTTGHYVLDSLDVDDDGNLTCTVHHVGGPGSRFLANMFGNGVFGVEIDTLVPCGCGIFHEPDLLGGDIDSGAVIESITEGD